MTARRKYNLLKRFLKVKGLLLSTAHYLDDMYGDLCITKVYYKGQKIACQMTSKDYSKYGRPAVLYHKDDFISDKTYEHAFKSLLGVKLFDRLSDAVYCIVPESVEELQMMLAIEGK